jgi:hypothetical protein
MVAMTVVLWFKVQVLQGNSICMDQGSDAYGLIILWSIRSLV